MVHKHRGVTIGEMVLVLLSWAVIMALLLPLFPDRDDTPENRLNNTMSNAQEVLSFSPEADWESTEAVRALETALDSWPNVPTPKPNVGPFSRKYDQTFTLVEDDVWPLTNEMVMLRTEHMMLLAYQPKKNQYCAGVVSDRGATRTSCVNNPQTNGSFIEFVEAGQFPGLEFLSPENHPNNTNNTTD